MKKILAPVDVPKLPIFLGLANYYRRFTKNFSLIAKPLTIFTSNDQPWTWGREEQQAFETLKQKMGTSLAFRYSDVSKSCQLHTNLAYWMWEQFSLRKMILVGSLLLLTHRVATTQRRPIICSKKEKHWQWCGLLPISDHISMVSAVLW